MIHIFLLACAVTCYAVNNGLARTPPMGWNSYNHFGCGYNEQVIRQTIQAMNNTGLAAVGYEYINLDDCWQSSRNNQGVIVPDSSRLPNGVKPLADFAHSLRLKFGLYSDAGTQTCAGRPGSLNYEQKDADTYAHWGVDYLKYDNCNNEGLPVKQRYQAMSKALLSCGRPILFSMCEWGVENPATWGPAIANSWRTTGDISDTWASITSRIDQNDAWWRYAGPGGWNDPDMLEVGNGVLSSIEYESHFSLWALAKAPLILGCDIRNMDADTKRIVLNSEVIAVNQDPLGVQGHKVAVNGNLEVWAGPLQEGSWVAILFNRGTSQATITANWGNIGIPNGVSCTVRDLWKHANLGVFTNSFSASVASHGVVMVKLIPKKGSDQQTVPEKVPETVPQTIPVTPPSTGCSVQVTYNIPATSIWWVQLYAPPNHNIELICNDNPQLVILCAYEWGNYVCDPQGKACNEPRQVIIDNSGTSCPIGGVANAVASDNDIYSGAAQQSIVPIVVLSVGIVLVVVLFALVVLLIKISSGESKEEQV
jgi:alpha-galactosidase